jgi:hypothetical protein
MACIIEHQVQFSETVPVGAKKIPEAQNRRLPRRDLFPRVQKPDLFRRDFYNPAGLADFFDQLPDPVFLRGL